MKADVLATTFSGLLTSMAVRAGLKRNRFPGIVEHAKALGVHRTHLYMVLDGRRQSASLVARYNQLIAETATR